MGDLPNTDAIGAGVAAYGLATAMLATLKAKKIFDQRDIDAIFKTLLVDAEKTGALSSSPEGRAAYRMLSELASTAAPSAGKPTQAN